MLCVVLEGKTRARGWKPAVNLRKNFLWILWRRARLPEEVVSTITEIPR